MAQDVKFLRESSFWYFLARRALERSADTLAGVLGSLEHRAAELSLPIHYPREHASAWAVLLQLFEVAGPYREVAGRFGYEMMLAGFDHVFGPKGTPKEVLSRLLGNLRSPAFPGRTRDETIVDTFLANAMKLTDANAVDPGDDALIMQTCLTDSVMLAFGREAVRPPEGLWETTTAEYVRRRPGFIRRQFSDSNSWLFASTTDPAAELTALLEEARRHSHTIFAAHGHELPRLLRDKELWTTIDKGHARALLTSERSASLAASHGATLRRPHLVMMTIEMIQLLSAVGALTLGFLSFRWWGLLLLLVVPLFMLASWRSAQLPRLRGRLPKVAALAFGIASLYLVAQGSPWALYALTLALTLVSLCSILRYAYPLRIIRRTLLESPQLTPALIDAGIVTLHRASELSEVRDRGF